MHDIVDEISPLFVHVPFHIKLCAITNEAARNPARNLDMVTSRN
jgi:hypothetical protein